MSGRDAGIAGAAGSPTQSTVHEQKRSSTLDSVGRKTSVRDGSSSVPAHDGGTVELSERGRNTGPGFLRMSLCDN